MSFSLSATPSVLVLHTHTCCFAKEEDSNFAQNHSALIVEPMTGGGFGEQLVSFSHCVCVMFSHWKQQFFSKLCLEFLRQLFSLSVRTLRSILQVPNRGLARGTLLKVMALITFQLQPAQNNLGYKWACYE